MKTGTLYHFFNGESNILAVLSGSEPVITFSSIVDLDAMITEGKVKSLTINSQKVKDLFAGKYYSKEMRLNELSAVLQVIELEPSDEQKAQIRRKDERRWLAQYEFTGSIPLTAITIAKEKQCGISEARHLLNDLLKRD